MGHIGGTKAGLFLIWADFFWQTNFAECYKMCSCPGKAAVLIPGSIFDPKLKLLLKMCGVLHALLVCV